MDKLELAIERGIAGEQEFRKRLNELGADYIFIDKWYDFEIAGTKVEVKTTMFSHKFHTSTPNQSYKVGRLLLTDEQKAHDLWYAVFVKHYDEILFMGMYLIPSQKSKYVSLHKLREFARMELADFVKMCQKKKKREELKKNVKSNKTKKVSKRNASKN